MKKLKLIVFMCLLVIPVNVFAKEYGITNYYVDVKVNENNTYNITENYNVTFFEDASFIKKIKLRPDIYLSNGKIISYVTEINNLNVTNYIDKNKTSRFYKIEFEKNNKSSSGSYNLQYQYNMGTDLDSSYDIVYVNITDKDYSYVAGNITFTILLPIEITNEEITIIKDGKTFKDPSITYQVVNGNYIQGTISNNVATNSDIAIQIKLPEGYFKNVQMTSGGTNFLLLIIPAISLAIGILLLKKYKNNSPKLCENPLAISDEFDSVELSYLYNGEITAKDVITTLITLANDGYITIKNYVSHFKITKIKEYDKDNAIQKIVCDGLFQNKKAIDVKDIEGIFYPYYTDACRTLQNKKNYLKLFYPFVDKYKIGLLIAILIAYISLQVQPLYNLLDSYVFAIILSIILSVIMISKYKQKNKILKYVSIGVTGLISLVGIIALIHYRLNLLIYILSMIAVEVTLYFENLIPTRTEYGEQKLYEINLFRLELTSMSDETFEIERQKDPNYFYKMLPYVMIFDMTSWWFNKFSNKIESLPSWYESNETYSHEKFQEFIQLMLEKLSIPIQVAKMHNDELLHQAPNKKL